MTVVSGPNIIRNVSHDMEKIKHSVGIDVHGDPYHLGVIQKSLSTQNLGERFDDLADEIVAAFSDLVPISDTWVKVPAHSTVTRIMCRTGNRLFVDLPICRNLEFITLSEYFATSLVRAARIIGVFPNCLKSFVGYYLTSVPRNLSRGMRILGPLLEERLEMEAEHGPNRPDKPNDLVSWLLEEAKESQRSIRDLTLRILLINSTVIHTTGMAASEALFDLAAHPSYIPELREEVESIIIEKGLNKESLEMMHKLDSFVKESSRTHTVCGLNMVAYVLKLMIAYILLNYDVKLDRSIDSIRPEGEWFMQMGFVSRKRNVMFRQRAF